MSRTVTVSVASDLVVILTDASNAAVTGLVSTDIAVEYRKDGGAFITKILALTDLIEVGSGVYEVKFTALELDTLGSFVYKVTGASISQYVEIIDILAAGQAATAASIDICVLTGHVFDVSGKPAANTTIIARLLGSPSMSGGFGILNSVVSARTDSNGEFFLPLARLSRVDITIPKMQYRRQLVVPNEATAALFTEVP
ncbi:MAG: hypothetical protein L3J47_00500 [Sulfurovum sp.]|nr:hypothetical protein [Sulfurovum sp.]